MAWFRDFGKWVTAVIKAWYGWLPGSGLAAAIGLGQNLQLWHAGRKTYASVIAIGVLVSLFEAWRKEHKAAGSSKPDFRIETTSAVSHYENGRTLVLLGMRIRNLGADSAIFSYSIEYKSPALHVNDAQLLIISNDSLCIPLPGGLFNFNKSQNILLQGAEPIKHGAFRSGRIPFLLEGDRTAEIRDGHGVITVTVTDYLDNKFKEVFKPTGESSKPMGYMFGENVANSPPSIVIGDPGILGQSAIKPKKGKSKKR